jgi:hypothetical protein
MPKSDVALSTLAKAAMASLIAAGALFAPSASFADEGGVSFWLPGLFGSLAAVPQQQPGFSLANIYYHDDVTAGSDVARARNFHRKTSFHAQRQPERQLACLRRS